MSETESSGVDEYRSHRNANTPEHLARELGRLELALAEVKAEYELLLQAPPRAIKWHRYISAAEPATGRILRLVNVFRAMRDEDLVAHKREKRQSTYEEWLSKPQARP